MKYVNFGKGWRHRLFVLHNGVLRYYKVTWKLSFCRLQLPLSSSQHGSEHISRFIS